MCYSGPLSPEVYGCIHHIHTYIIRQVNVIGKKVDRWLNVCLLFLHAKTTGCNEGVKDDNSELFFKYLMRYVHSWNFHRVCNTIDAITTDEEWKYNKYYN